MLLKTSPIPPVPLETARVATLVFPRGNLFLQLRDSLGTMYTDEAFADLFPTHGQPAEAPWRLALVTVFQFLEHLTDRQAADAVRSRLDWKYCLSLEITDKGFHHTVLSEFRSRLVAGNAALRLLDSFLECCRNGGWLKLRGRQRTDSTHVLARIRALNRMLCVAQTMVYVLNVLAEVAPEWLRLHTLPEWDERYGRRMENYRFPKAETERSALGATIGRDGVLLLQALENTPEMPWLRDVPALQTLRRIWREQYTEFSAEAICFREKKDLDIPANLIASPYDTEARFSTKRGMDWVGYVRRVGADEIPASGRRG